MSLAGLVRARLSRLACPRPGFAYKLTTKLFELLEWGIALTVFRHRPINATSRASGAISLKGAPNFYLALFPAPPQPPKETLRIVGPEGDPAWLVA